MNFIIAYPRNTFVPFVFCVAKYPPVNPQRSTPIRELGLPFVVLELRDVRRDLVDGLHVPVDDGLVEMLEPRIADHAVVDVVRDGQVAGEVCRRRRCPRRRTRWTSAAGSCSPR